MTPEVEAEALLVVGTLESGLTWNAVDYTSNIKVGLAGWRGGDAAALLASLPVTEQGMLAQSLRDDLATHASTDPFWNARFLTKDEGNSVITALGTQDAEQAQRQAFSTMLADIESTMSTWGCDAGGTVAQQRAFIFYAAIFHVSLVDAANICGAIGGQASVRNIFDAIMNRPALSPLRDWAAARDLLEEWEGSEPTVDPGTEEPWTEPGGGGQSQTSIPQVLSQIQRIGMTGQQLIVYGADNEGGVVCYRETNDFWIPAGNTAAPPTPTPINPPAPDEPATTAEWEQMRQLYYDNEGAWVYGQGPGRLDPPASGYTDCSGAIVWAVSQVRPDLAEALGVYTGSMRNAGTEVARGTTGQGAYVDPAILQPGDILLVGTDYAFDNQSAHAEWYFGNGELWGAGYSPLPHRSGDINAYLEMIASRGKTVYMIRRFLS